MMQILVCNPVLETSVIKYSVQPGCHWLDKGYYPGTKQAHTGIDLNDVRGGNSDLGNLVRCIADGVVVEAGEYDDWGGIVLVYHAALQVYSQYAHLYGIKVKAGQVLQMGDALGQIGRGEHNQFWAHLHFEVRRSKLAASYWPSTYVKTRAAAEAFIKEHYLDPEGFLRQHNALRTFDEVMTARAAHPSPTEAAKRPPAATAPKTGTIWAQVQDVDGKPRAGEVVSIAVDGEGRILADKKTGRPKVIRVPASRLHERKY